MEMNDFEKQMKRYGQSLGEERCPLTQAELDREVRRATWTTASNGAKPSLTRRIAPRTQWRYVAAAACLLAVLTPVAIRLLRTPSTASDKPMVFACNRGCSEEGTVAMFHDFVKGGQR